MILDHIARARRQGLPYVYLGYWIEGSRRMDYKCRFLPQQRILESYFARLMVQPHLIGAATGAAAAVIGPSFCGQDHPLEGEVGVVNTNLWPPGVG